MPALEIRALTKRFGPAKPRLPVEDLAPITLPAPWLQNYADGIERLWVVSTALRDLPPPVRVYAPGSLRLPVC